MNLYNEYLQNNFKYEIVGNYLDNLSDLYNQHEFTNFHAVTDRETSSPFPAINDVVRIQEV